jgi:hypothetical protein
MSGPYRPPSAPRPSRPDDNRYDNRYDEPTAEYPAGEKRSQARLLLAVGAIAVIGLAVLLGTVVLGGKPKTSSGTGAAKKAASVASPAEHSVAASAAGRQKAQLEMTSGAETIVIRSSDIGDDLYRVSTPQNSSLVPKATVTGDTVQLTLATSGDTGAATAEVVLSDKVVWQLKLSGGGMKETVDFSTGKLSGLEFPSGASDIEVTLPKIDGSVTVKLAGGAGQVKVHAPQNIPVQVKVGGAGAGVVTVDGQTKNSVKAGTDITPTTWAKAKDRFSIDAAAGLAKLIVDRTK